MCLPSANVKEIFAYAKMAVLIEIFFIFAVMNENASLITAVFKCFLLLLSIAVCIVRIDKGYVICTVLITYRNFGDQRACARGGASVMIVIFHRNKYFCFLNDLDSDFF